MLREFAPLITAIIIAGRSGSAYAAQIGTMVVTEEIDAMRTIGIDPLELLVLPKIVALVDRAAAADGVRRRRWACSAAWSWRASQLDVGFGEFLDRFGQVVQRHGAA